MIPKIGRNDPCYCGSGHKFKKCCINEPIEKQLEAQGWDVQSQDLTTYTETTQTLELLISECVEQFKQRKHFKFDTSIKHPDDMIKEFEQGVIIYHLLDKNDAGEWFFKPHMHCIGSVPV